MKSESLPPPDPDDFMREVMAAWEPGYTDENRYADFRQLFLGSQQGKRVLHQILTWARLWATNFDPDGRIHAFKEGERNLGQRIVTAINVEPKPRPAVQTRKRKVIDE